jgi:CRISPR/Cas system-associated protein Csm6
MHVLGVIYQEALDNRRKMMMPLVPANERRRYAQLETKVISAERCDSKM